MACKYLCLIKCTFHYFLFVLLKTKPGIAWFVLVWQKKSDRWVGWGYGRREVCGNVAKESPEKRAEGEGDLYEKKYLLYKKKIFFVQKIWDFCAAFSRKLQTESYYSLDTFSDFPVIRRGLPA